MTTTDQPTAGVALKPCPMCQGDQIRLKSAIGESWARCEGCGFSTDTFASEAQVVTAWNTRTPASGAVEAAVVTRLQGVVSFFDGTGTASLSSSESKQHAEDIKTVLAALTSEPKAEGESKPLSYGQKGKRLYEAFWSRNGGDAPAWDEQAPAIRTMWMNIARDADQYAAPQPLQGGGVTVPVRLIERTINLLPVSAPRKELAALISPARREGEG